MLKFRVVYVYLAVGCTFNCQFHVNTRIQRPAATGFLSALRRMVDDANRSFSRVAYFFQYGDNFTHTDCR